MFTFPSIYMLHLFTSSLYLFVFMLIAVIIQTTHYSCLAETPAHLPKGRGCFACQTDWSSLTSVQDPLQAGSPCLRPEKLSQELILGSLWMSGTKQPFSIRFPRSNTGPQTGVFWGNMADLEGRERSICSWILSLVFWLEPLWERSKSGTKTFICVRGAAALIL